MSDLNPPVYAKGDVVLGQFQASNNVFKENVQEVYNDTYYDLQYGVKQSKVSYQYTIALGKSC